MTSREDALDTAALGGPEPLPVWEDLAFSEPELPDDYTETPRSFDDAPPPQLVRTINLLPIPEHDVRGPEDVEGIAAHILARAREGIADLFAHEDYAGYEGEPTEAWARAIAEHQTGIPYTMPVYFYGSQKQVADRVARQGRYPLVGQCQQSVTTALCIGGWDGGANGDVGAGKDSQPYCARLGKGWTDVPLDLKKWPDELWADVKVGSCLFWSADAVGSGHVALVIRKHPVDRKWQIWDTGTSFHDPSNHLTAARQARLLWESHWWDYIPKSLSNGSWPFRGIGLISGLGQLRSDLRPRGRARLLLQRRSDKALLFRSAWIDMEAEGLPISWLLRGLRGAPFSDQVEATFCINSPPGLTKSSPRGTPLLDCTADAKGNARMSWSWQWKQGYHERKNPAVWQPDAPFLGGASDAGKAQAVSGPEAPGRAEPDPHAQAEAELRAKGERRARGILRSALLSGVEELEGVAGGRGAIKQGARGAGAKAIQEALIALGFQVPGGADGAFGKGTADALKSFQAQAGLGPDGVAGAGTLKVLDQRLQGLPRTSDR
ncbi:peptidoglycan-binding domain-containing protein [Sorangium sp. So ce1128]